MITPTSEAELADAITACAATSDGALHVQGHNTRGTLAPGTALSTRHLTGITLYEPGALTLMAQTGTPVAEIEATLAENNQRLAFEPMDHRALLGTSGTPTIGGACAANVSGPRRIQVGAARDFMLGVRLVDGRGEVLRNGGRVMKNVTGYDLVKLMAGAHGTLGVLSEVALKVLPQPETMTTLTLTDIDIGDAIAAMSAALGAPYDITGAAYDPAQRAAYIRIEGFAQSVQYRATELSAQLSTFGPVQHQPESDALWEDIRDVRCFGSQTGDIWRISVKPSDAVALLPALGAKQTLCDWGGGLIWALMPEGEDLRAKMNVPGHATLLRAAPHTYARLPRHHPEPAALAALARGLRAQFDPKGILNPGLMG